MTDQQEILRLARECHSRAAWHHWFAEYSNVLQVQTNDRALSEIVYLLLQDELSAAYDSSIWQFLMELCFKVWNLDLALKIAEHVKTTSSTRLSILFCRAYAEKGHPTIARKIAIRALRHIAIRDGEYLQLQVLVCQSYVDEGRRSMAVRLANQIRERLRETAIEDSDRAEFLTQVARTNFFLGRYPQAASIFAESFELYKKLGNWSEAARAIYNAGSSYFSAGGKLAEKAFPLVEECRRISELHNLAGPLSHVEAFYGHDAYWHGDFAGARDSYRRAYKYIPRADQGFRTLHVLSMLTFIYLRTGQFDTARNFGKKTLDLASHDDSIRFRSRYHNLRAELMWEDGKIFESQNFLRGHVESLQATGVNTLEEISTLSRYFWQSAKLGVDLSHLKIAIADPLKKNTGDWVEHLYARGLLNLSHGRWQEAQQDFDECFLRAKNYGDKFHIVQSLIGKCQLELAMKSIERTNVTQVQCLVKDLEIALAKITETPSKIHLYLIRAAIAYRAGDLEGTRQQLIAAKQFGRSSYCDRFVLDAWLATSEGHAVKFGSGWQYEVLRKMTDIYFAPTLEVFENSFSISGQYLLDLKQHPALNELLRFLIGKPGFEATFDEFQTKVWKESTTLQGWHQKIRNAINRLRSITGSSMVPLIIVDDKIRLNYEMIKISKPRLDSLSQDQIMKLLAEGPLSSVNLANRLNVSKATAKRILSKLVQQHEITVMKLGRNIYYQAL